MELTLNIAKVLAKLRDGETIASSTVKSKVINDLVNENILLRRGKIKKSLELISKSALETFLENQLQIKDLDSYIAALQNDDSSRAEFVKITTDSKTSRERAFKGFLVNSYQSIAAELSNEVININPPKGSFIFISDFETFKIPTDITVIGVENAKNFSQIHEQKYLFDHLTPLFISRYPQNQNKDFIRWMNSIPNNYLHFGDFDLAGIGIYLNEYKKHLGSKASLFIPENIKSMVSEFGNRQRFDLQKLNFKIEDIQEVAIQDLIKIIMFEKKGLDQEYFIEEI